LEYSSDSGLGYLHPNAAGDVILGYLMYNAAVPARTRDWGNAAYPQMGHESWSWWIGTDGGHGAPSLTGGTTDSVTGQLNGGSLNLPQSSSAVSDVLAFVPGSNNITITSTVTQGAVVIKYQTYANNEYRTQNSAWITYTGPFTTSNNFVQIQLSNTQATTAIVSIVKLDWSGTASPPSAIFINGQGLNIK
jgi:hypothetical protein